MFILDLRLDVDLLFDSHIIDDDDDDHNVITLTFFSTCIYCVKVY